MEGAGESEGGREGGRDKGVGGGRYEVTQSPG